MSQTKCVKSPHLHTDASLCCQCRQTCDLQKWGSCASQPAPAASGWRPLCSPDSGYKSHIRLFLLTIFSASNTDWFDTNLQDVDVRLQHADARAQRVGQLEELLAARHVSRHTQVRLLLLHDLQQLRRQRVNVCGGEEGETGWMTTSYEVL